MKGEDLIGYLVPSYFDVMGYEIVIIQDAEGNLITLKIVNYEG
tara:strand:- start:317 stop:445 length:129 start_codon:yes stop_codon:yes gene_type:complete